MDPTNSFVCYLRGKMNANLCKWKNSIKNFTQCLKIDPDYWQCYSFRGYAYF